MTEDTSELEKVPQVYGDPEYEAYVDSFFMNGTTYTTILNFGVRENSGLITPKALLRMSPEHAKVLAILFKRALQDMEAQMGIQINVAPNTLVEKKIDLAKEWENRA